MAWEFTCLEGLQQNQSSAIQVAEHAADAIRRIFRTLSLSAPLVQSGVDAVEKQYEAFMSEMSKLGAL